MDSFNNNEDKTFKILRSQNEETIENIADRLMNEKKNGSYAIIVHNGIELSNVKLLTKEQIIKYYNTENNKINRIRYNSNNNETGDVHSKSEYKDENRSGYSSNSNPSNFNNNNNNSLPDGENNFNDENNQLRDNGVNNSYSDLNTNQNPNNVLDENAVSGDPQLSNQNLNNDQNQNKDDYGDNQEKKVDNEIDKQASTDDNLSDGADNKNDGKNNSREDNSSLNNNVNDESKNMETNENVEHPSKNNKFKNNQDLNNGNGSIDRQNSSLTNNQKKNSTFNNGIKNADKENKSKDNITDKVKDAAKDKAKDSAKKKAKKEAKKKIDAETKKKIVEIIMAHPEIIAIAAIIIVILALIIFLIILTNNGDLTTGSNGSNYSCGSSVDSPISVTQTPLSRSQFIEALQNYQSSNSHYANLRDNAGLVYDLGVEYGINPELAVIRAELEGYSPGSNYNYWGIGCYNGSGSDGSCRGSYSSLENGLIAFYNTIKAYNTDNIYEVMSRYAYIGDTWYYPGSSSRGGCYYYPYIREYLTPTRDAQVGTSCEQGTEITTTDEDQLAYTKWQVDRGTMAKRLAIFNLEADSVPVCESYDVDATPTPTSAEGILTSDDGTVETILAQHGSSIAQLNDKIKQNTLQKGIGSREAVAGAAAILINTFDSYGYRLPYSYSGGWGGGYNDNPAVTSYYGVNPAVGALINNGSGYTVQFDSGPTTYYYVGYDCSGFVAWALRNGGINHSVIGASSYRNDDGDVAHSACSTEYIGKPGDVLANAHHVILILKYNEADQTYTIAEAKGKSYGILSSTVSLSSLCSYDVVDMSYYYENAVNSNFEVDFEAGRKG